MLVVVSGDVGDVVVVVGGGVDVVGVDVVIAGGSGTRATGRHAVAQQYWRVTCERRT